MIIPFQTPEVSEGFINMDYNKYFLSCIISISSLENLYKKLFLKRKKIFERNSLKPYLQMKLC